MNVKNDVIESLRVKLEKLRSENDYKLRVNSGKINMLSRENETLKREKVELSKLINSLE